MKAQIEIEVESQEQADAIQTAINDPEIRAFATITGLLLPKSQQARKRILNYVADLLTEE